MRVCRSGPVIRMSFSLSLIALPFIFAAHPTDALAQEPVSGAPAFLNFAPENGAWPIRSLDQDDWVLRGPARPGAFIDAIGRSAVWMGTEQGTLEAWVWPWKIFHGFNLAVRTGEVGSEIDMTDLARTVEVRPYGVQITCVHSRFQIRQTLLAHAVDPTLMMLLEVDTSTDLTIVASFIPDLLPMWPAGMGGQYAWFDAGAPGYVLGESRGKVNAVVGSPDATRGSSAPAHQLAGASAFEIPVTRERAGEGPIVMVITGGEEERQETLARYRRTVALGGELLAERKRAWAEGPRVVDITLPDHRLEEAYRWAVSSLTDGHQRTPGLGTGLVAGFGPTGSGFRPGFSWYFGGDTSINSFGLVAAGQGWVLADAFPFLEGFQREDGKMMHELTRSATLIDWFGEYPYAWIHGDTTPFYIVALANYIRWTDDRTLLERSWPHLMKAYEFGKWADEDGDGLMDNSRAGLGASELGSLREGLKTGVFIATVWTRALSDLAYLAELRGELDLIGFFENEHQRARERLAELFIDPKTETLNFGVAVSGESKNDATAWATFPIVFGLIEGEAAENTLDMVASARITTDWGTRMLSEDNPFYDPVGYNNGAVWPFLTGYVAMAEYAAGRRYAGYQHLQQVARTTFIDALGRQPEVMSGDYFTSLETTVPHQLFSASPVPANLIRGVLGLELDLPNNTITVAPQLPGGWTRLQMHGYPLPGGGFLGFNLARTYEGRQVSYTLRVSGPEGLTVRFAPRPNVHERLSGKGTDERTLRSGNRMLEVRGRRGFELDLDGLRWGTSEEGPVRAVAREGDAPTGLRVIRVEEEGDDTINLTLEGRTGYMYRLPYLTPPGIELLPDQEIEVDAAWDTALDDGPALRFTVREDDGTAVGVDDYRRFTIRLRMK